VVLLRTGVAGHTVIEVARSALKQFGGLIGLLSALPRELQKVSGFGPAKCAQLRAVPEQSAAGAARGRQARCGVEHPRKGR